jgi:NADH:ubiquinone oxidoreductase subunit C
MTDEFTTNLTNRLHGLAKRIESPKPRRFFIEISRDSLLEVVKILKDEFDGYHISTITVLDSGANFELLYHILLTDGLATLRVFLPRDDPSVETLTSILPGAILYERELHDIMGIEVKNHPDMRTLLLPDSWGDKGYPLRKDWADPRAKEGKK